MQKHAIEFEPTVLVLCFFDFHATQVRCSLERGGEDAGTGGCLSLDAADDSDNIAWGDLMMTGVRPGVSCDMRGDCSRTMPTDCGGRIGFAVETAAAAMASRMRTGVFISTSCDLVLVRPAW